MTREEIISLKKTIFRDFTLNSEALRKSPIENYELCLIYERYGKKFKMSEILRALNIKTSTKEMKKIPYIC
ncbi:hypothetical protein ACEXAJ_07355 [Fusobacterium necrophorum subsp. funduliforme]